MVCAFKLVAIASIWAYVTVGAYAVCDTTVMNTCVQTLINNVQANISNIMDSSNLNNLCSFVAKESECLSAAGCTNATADSTGNSTSAGLADSYLYLCNDGRQAFLAASPCLNTTAAMNATQSCYNTTMAPYMSASSGQNINYTAYCQIEKSYLGCAATAIKGVCTLDAANFFVNYTIRLIQPTFSQTNNSCILNANQTNSNQSSGADKYHVAMALFLAALVATLHMVAE